jgi:hypothetical protein
MFKKTLDNIKQETIDQAKYEFKINLSIGYHLISAFVFVYAVHTLYHAGMIVLSVTMVFFTMYYLYKTIDLISHYNSLQLISLNQK